MAFCAIINHTRSLLSKDGVCKLGREGMHVLIIFGIMKEGKKRDGAKTGAFLGNDCIDHIIR